ncbi:MAG TPA: prolipoprotein diacylglyceryl transferase family protein [Patescibacteria group bacterium]
MQFILEISLVSLFVFLYCIFVFAKDDFILLRKNITLEQLFNISFVIYILGFLFARLVYVLEHISPKYLDPFVLFLFPYFPGLSISGGILIGIAYLLIILNKKRLPFFRVFDIFSISFIYAFSAGLPIFAVIEFLLTRKIPFIPAIEAILYFVLAVILTLLFVKNKIKDGSTVYLGISFFSLFFIAFSIQITKGKISFNFTPEDVVLVFIWFFFFAMFFYQQNEFQLAGKKKK